MKFAVIGGKIYTVNKEEKVIEEGTILINNGKIEAVLEGKETPEGYEIIDVSNNYVLPGFIDTHTHQGLWDGTVGWAGYDGNEMTDPNTAQVRSIDAINPETPALEEAKIGGVTTIQTGPGSGNVIGGTNVIIKTWCKSKIIDDLIVKEPSSLKSALGENPKRAYGTEKKMPSTRMGTGAVFRQAFIDAQNYAKKWVEYEKKKKQAEETGEIDKIPAEPDRDLKKEVILKVLNNEIPLNMHCHQANDIVTAIRFKEEFGYDLMLVHATEGHKIADYISKKGIPCSLGPSLVGMEKVELRNISFETPFKLWKAGVKISIQSDSFTRLRHFQILPCMAVKEGLPINEALKAITINAAEMIGVDDRLGSLEAGKDADIVIWTNHPIENFYAENKIAFINGEIAYKMAEKDN
ncbi:MAG: amidohydrolase [Candidatus Heimdallarchaeota archaeon]|nr:amidohydrolase [Candidatus Heimdallarchaeota archaeon]MCK4769405.1 amidohydrolase [Candidatus Heimdallarchaeota archaeon]